MEGQLSDAIREHLELKRRHGASDDEIAREEAEALGPVRRQPDAVEPAAPEGERPFAERDDAPLEAETALLDAFPRREEPIEADGIGADEPELLDEELDAEELEAYGPAAEEPELLDAEELEPYAVDETRRDDPGPLEPPRAEEPLAGEHLDEDVLDEERLVADEEAPAGTADPLETGGEPDEVASVFPEPEPTVPDERMSAEEPPPIGPRPLVDEAPVVHDEPLAEEDDAPLPAIEPAGEDVPPYEEPPPYEEDVPSAEAPFPSGEPGLDDPFATQPHALPPLSEDEEDDEEPLEPPALLEDEESMVRPVLLEDDEEPLGEPVLLEDEEEPLEPPALLEEDELEMFEEQHEGAPAGAIELEDEPIEGAEEEDVAPTGAYEHGVDEPPDLDDDAPRTRPTPPPGSTDSFDFDA